MKSRLLQFYQLHEKEMNHVQNNYLIFTLLFSLTASALTVLEINTEFLWDDKVPHEGRLAGDKFPIPTRAAYQDELNYYATLITQSGAEVVGLIELEGCHVARDLARLLGKEWKSVCKKGRDTFTAQDVALLTSFSVNPKSVTNHSKSYYKLNGKKSRPSKALTALIGSGGNTYSVTVAHLVSKRSNNDEKRLKQARAITKTVNLHASVFKPQHIIIMGDLNDTVGSPALEAFKVANVQHAAIGSSCSYVFRNQCDLIDHILVSEGLQGGSFSHIDLPTKYSDHHAVKYVY